MFKYNNSHIFTGYLKQLLSSFHLPTCRIYTNEFADYFNKHGKEDPRVIESFDTIGFTNEASSITKYRIASRTNYLRNNELCNYFWDYSQAAEKLGHNNSYWRQTSPIFYCSDERIPGLNKTLKSAGGVYDTATHEYLGDYLRFLRDYYNVNLMSLYNCFNNKVYNNIYYKHRVSAPSMTNTSPVYSIFDSHDSKYILYAFPVKLFYDYTIAIDCADEIEMFCGLYSTTLNTTSIGTALIARTYKKVRGTLFKQPFLFDKLNVKYWNFQEDSVIDANGYPKFINNGVTRWDIANMEQDLKLFIKVPTSCKSSITVLEGDFRTHNDILYVPCAGANDTNTSNAAFVYKQNHAVVNFGDSVDKENGLNINNSAFNPISKLQLLALNTGESYPFADRLVEYLCNSAITPIDEIPDNIKRAQKVMSNNRHYFRIDGVWEPKMQKIVYDYLTTSGPVEVQQYTDKLGKLKLATKDKRLGYHRRLGHVAKSTLYDTLGYIDKDAEKYYASWMVENNEAVVRDTIQNVDIYNGLYDL